MQVWSTIKTILVSKNKLKRGFTLVELLVVIVILGVLSTLGVVSVTKIINGSKEKVFKQEAVAFINAARAKSAETIVPDGGLCYSISDLAEYVEKDITGYSGSVFVSSENKYKIWLSKGSYIINAGIVDDMDVVSVSGQMEASSICPSSFISIIVNANGGTWDGELPNVAYEGQKIDLTNMGDPIKTGYIFTGWTPYGEGSDITDNILTVGSETVALIANWIPGAFVLTVNANGGTWSGTTPQSITYGDSVTINIPIKTGTAFLGWTVSGEGSSMNGTTFTMGEGNATITAKWLTFTYMVGGNPGVAGVNYSFIDDGNGDWRIKFLTDGTFISDSYLLTDVFLLGGGGGGNPSGNGTDSNGGGGGSGGYTLTAINKTINASTSYNIIIGAGGVPNGAGSASSAFNLTAAGGLGGTGRFGSNGGSGGGGAGQGYGTPGAGGSNGSNGIDGSNYAGGTGQGVSTYEFGNSSLTLYAGGGGAGGGPYSTSPQGAAGGLGGGATGGNRQGGTGASAAANTGGGGGGGGAKTGGVGVGGSGGSGIVVIRNSSISKLGTIVTVGNTTKYSFIYTGIYELVDPSTDYWEIKLLGSGNYIPLSTQAIDAFLVGGGGSGGKGAGILGADYRGGGGGGGGFTTNQSNLSLTTQIYPVKIGAGGALSGSGYAASGESTTAFSLTAAGGQGGEAGGQLTGGAGGSGGSAGGHGWYNNMSLVLKNGLSYGSSGQGTTTCKFGEGTTTACTYGNSAAYGAGGGGGGGYGSAGGTAGLTGAGAGASESDPKGYDALANTGGGGGGAYNNGSTNSGGKGGSGIVIIRAHR